MRNLGCILFALIALVAPGLGLLWLSATSTIEVHHEEGRVAGTLSRWVVHEKLVVEQVKFDRLDDARLEPYSLGPLSSGERVVLVTDVGELPLTRVASPNLDNSRRLIRSLKAYEIDPERRPMTRTESLQADGEAMAYPGGILVGLGVLSLLLCWLHIVLYLAFPSYRAQARKSVAEREMEQELRQEARSFRGPRKKRPLAALAVLGCGFVLCQGVVIGLGGAMMRVEEKGILDVGPRIPEEAVGALPFEPSGDLAREWRRCRNGSVFHCRWVADRIVEGRGVDTDWEVGERLLRAVCRADPSECDGLRRLGKRYEEADGTERDLARARELYEAACGGDDPVACNDLGIIFERGEQVEEDLERAAGFYARACDGGSQAGCLNMARLWEEGRGVQRSDEQRARYLRRACSCSSLKGCQSLLEMCAAGEASLPEAVQVRIRWLACDLGAEEYCSG